MSNGQRKEAIALQYDNSVNQSPIVKAKGKGLIAEQIIQNAMKKNIPIHEDKALVELFNKLQVNINEEIPEDLFMAVAEVFSFIYQMEQRAKANI